MTRINDGGPAFPRPASEYTANGTLHDGNDAEQAQDGMTLRDYFAAAAITGILATDDVNFREYDIGRLAYVPNERALREAAEIAYVQADAMLAQRAKKEPTNANPD